MALPSLDHVQSVAAILIPYIRHIDNKKTFRAHGERHCIEVGKHIHNLMEICNLSGTSLKVSERRILDCACWLHDLGRIFDSDDHGKKSAEIIDKLIHTGHLNLGDIADEVEWVVMTHSGEGFDRLNDVDEIRRLSTGEDVRLRFLCCLFKIADECDTSIHRAPPPVYEILKDTMDSGTKKFWLRHDNFINVEILCHEKQIVVHMRKPGEEEIIDSLKITLDNVNLKDLLQKNRFPSLEIVFRYHNRAL